MKSCTVAFLSLFLATSVLCCNKNDATYPNTGIIYRTDDVNNEIAKGGDNQKKSPPLLDPQELNNKLRSMSKNDLFQFALTCGNEGNYAAALMAYTTLLEKDKNYPDIYYYQGLLYRDMGLQDEAICAFQTAITQNPASAEAHYNLGFAYRCKGLHHEAIPQYQKSLALLSEDKTKQKASVHYNLGFSYFAHGMIDDAIREFNQALAYKPKDREIHQKLGIAYTAKGWTDKAKDEFLFYRADDKPPKKIP